MSLTQLIKIVQMLILILVLILIIDISIPNYYMSHIYCDIYAFCHT